MSQALKSLADWPREKTGKPILTDTGEALYFAQLIWRDEDLQKMLQFLRDSCYAKLKFERETKDPNLDRMFSLAVEAQLFRECLEECQRINDERLTTIPQRRPLEGA